MDLLSRQAQLFPEGTIDTMKFCIIGAGNIGSNVTEMLARMGATSITIYDRATVANENVYPSGFAMSDIGELKVDAIQSRILGDLDTDPVVPTPRKFTLQRGEYDVVVVGTDTMSSRRIIWEENRLTWTWWIDARMGGDAVSIYCTNGKEPSLGLYLHSLEHAHVNLPCGQKATAPLTMGMIPGMVGSCLYRIVHGKQPPSHLYWKMGDLFWTCVTDS